MSQGDTHVRWACHAANWNASPAEWNTALNLLTPIERERVNRFVFEKDRRLALIGQLLIRAYLRTVQHLELSDVIRTVGRKPVLRPKHGGSYPNGTFNVSHHGEWVVLAAEPVALVGVDVMRVELPGSLKSAEGLFRDLRDTLTDGEWVFVRGQGHATEDAQLRRFYRLWTLKECYVKALGVGIAHELRRLHFTVSPDDRHATLQVDGKSSGQWAFELSWIDNLHPVAVALGPAAAADAEQQASITSVPDAVSAWRTQYAATSLTPPSFRIVTPEWLCSV